MKSLLDNVMTEISTFLQVYAKLSAGRGVKKQRVTFSDVLEFDTSSRSTLPPIRNSNNRDV